MDTNFVSAKSAKSANTHLHSSPWHSERDCNIAILIENGFICDDLAILCVNLVNFGPVTSEFSKVKDVHPSFLFFKINLSDKLSQDSQDVISPKFHHMVYI